MGYYGSRFEASNALKVVARGDGTLGRRLLEEEDRWAERPLLGAYHRSLNIYGDQTEGMLDIRPRISTQTKSRAPRRIDP